VPAWPLDDRSAVCFAVLLTLALAAIYMAGTFDSSVYSASIGFLAVFSAAGFLLIQRHHDFRLLLCFLVLSGTPFFHFARSEARFRSFYGVLRVVSHAGREVPNINSWHNSARYRTRQQWRRHAVCGTTDPPKYHFMTFHLYLSDACFS
jgi:hypothetical protein